MELYCPIGGTRGFKAQLAALYGGIPLTHVDTSMATTKSPAFLAMNPAGKVPVLKTPSGALFESNAMARYLCQVANTQLYPRPPFDAPKAARAASIDMWIDFSQAEIDRKNGAVIGLLFGYTPYDKASLAAAKAAIMASLKGLDAHLTGRTYVVGDAVTLADVVLFTDVKNVFQYVLDPADRAHIPHAVRWFTTLLGQPHFAKVAAKWFTWCDKMMDPGAPKAGAANAAAPAAAAGKDKGKDKPAAPPKAASAPKVSGKDDAGTKKDVRKETQLGLSASKSGDFAAWYSQVVTEGEMIDYYDISGCYILRPWSYALWENIKDFFDAAIKKSGVENAYFPLFVSKRALEAEANHIEGFAPEVAWVTRSGDSELEEPIAVRPTSETIMYPAYARWVRSHRDLPLRLNQWCNVVRWEFKHPTPFIRSREFLWQEGHTVFATKAEADKEVREILELYRRVYEELLAVPVIPGVKSEKEKFAGGLYTTTVEAFIPATGKGIQGATSHCLGQNFAKMFGIEYESEAGGKAIAWQNSWGLTTRTIGVCIMVHGDDKGLVLPPKVSPIQVVVIPIPNSKMGPSDAAALQTAAADIAAQLSAAGVRVKTDARDNYTPGWKYNHWELKGVPVRLELGPRDVAAGKAVLARRDNGDKVDAPWSTLVPTVQALLVTIQADMLVRATAARDAQLVTITRWEDFTPALDAHKMVLAPWCESPEIEDDVKRRSGEEAEGGAAKTLCLPFEQPPLPKGTKCFASGKPATIWALWGRSY